jgi:hypothetical protein
MEADRFHHGASLQVASLFDPLEGRIDGHGVTMPEAMAHL